MKPELIFCGGGNYHRAKIAKDSGFLLGAQLPNTTVYDVYKPLYFADQDFKRPRYTDYIKSIRRYQPYMASVLDIEEWRRLDEYLMRAEEISQHCQVVMLIPKVKGIIKELPRTINGKQVRLGYSIPTSFGGTTVPIGEFQDWPVHLLGGNPLKQLSLYKEFNTISVDGNSHNGMANRCQFFVPDKFSGAVNKHWPTLFEFHGKRWDGNGPLEAFGRSCKAIMEMWGIN